MTTERVAYGPRRAPDLGGDVGDGAADVELDAQPLAVVEAWRMVAVVAVRHRIRVRGPRHRKRLMVSGNALASLRRVPVEIPVECWAGKRREWSGSRLVRAAGPDGGRVESGVDDVADGGWGNLVGQGVLCSPFRWRGTVAWLRSSLGEVGQPVCRVPRAYLRHACIR